MCVCVFPGHFCIVFPCFPFVVVVVVVVVVTSILEPSLVGLGVFADVAKCVLSHKL